MPACLRLGGGGLEAPTPQMIKLIKLVWGAPEKIVKLIKTIKVIKSGVGVWGWRPPAPMLDLIVLICSIGLINISWALPRSTSMSHTYPATTKITNNYNPSVLAKGAAHRAWLAPALCIWHARLQISLSAPTHFRQPPK